MIKSTLQAISKTCKKCKEVKEMSLFYKSKTTRDGRESQCKKCRNAHTRKWRQETKEERTAWRRKYEQENYEKNHEKNKIYRANNKEKLSLQSKNYNERDRGTMEYALRRLLYSARTRAKQKNLPFDLTVEWLETMVVTHCPITLEPLNWTREQVAGGGPRTNSPSIDKIIPELGYVQSNCAIISARANRIKNDGTIDEHLRTVQYMAAQQLRDTEF